MCVCVCVCARARVVLWLNWLESEFGKWKHPGPCRVASSSDGELWHNFLGQETNTQLPLSIQEYK